MRVHRSVRALMFVLCLAVALGAAPSAFAKGRPMQATFTRSSCFSWAISATWWKKLEVRGLKVEVFTSTDQSLGAWAWDDAAGLVSPFARSIDGSGASATMYAVVTIYAGTDPLGLFGPPPAPLDSVRTSTVTVDCGI